MKTNAKTIASVITPEELLEHWQGHRALTRKVIEAFPENDLFNFSVGGMRPFYALAMEMIDLAYHGLKGVTANEWKEISELPHYNNDKPVNTKEDLLQLWDSITQEIDRLWMGISLEHFHYTTLAFGQYEGTVFSVILYWIDNEIHHRGQGYVYLRALGITPPPFWERY